MTDQNQNEITHKGNPAKPQGQEGHQMLERMNQSHNEVTNWALSFFNLNENDCALDIGCGGGNTISLLAKTCQKVYGVDYSDVSVAESTNYNQALVEAGKVDIQQGNVAQLAFADHTFDKITTVESFYFWPDPQENLKEVLRVLKENGVFLMVCDTYLKPGLSQETLENIEKYHLFITDEAGYQTMFEKAGFSNVRVHTKPGTDWICVEGKKSSFFNR